MAVTWTCPGSKDAALEPGVCSDGQTRTKTFTPRPHGNHNPQHGGQFFMAPDNWHHLEGAYPRAGVFRLYLYDDYTKPLALPTVRDVSGRLITADGLEIPLKRQGRILQATIPRAALPLEPHAQVRFAPGAPENRFDFTFSQFSKDAVPPAATVSMPTAAVGHVTPPAAGGTPAATSTPAGISIGLAASDIPTHVPQTLKALQTRADQIKSLITQGQFGAVYVPAFKPRTWRSRWIVAERVLLPIVVPSSNRPPRVWSGKRTCLTRLAILGTKNRSPPPSRTSLRPSRRSSPRTPPAHD
jgi:hypothetical protein